MGHRPLLRIAVHRYSVPCASLNTGASYVVCCKTYSSAKIGRAFRSITRELKYTRRRYSIGAHLPVSWVSLERRRRVRVVSPDSFRRFRSRMLIGIGRALYTVATAQLRRRGDEYNFPGYVCLVFEFRVRTSFGITTSNGPFKKEECPPLGRSTRTR